MVSLLGQVLGASLYLFPPGGMTPDLDRGQTVELEAAYQSDSRLELAFEVRRSQLNGVAHHGSLTEFWIVLEGRLSILEQLGHLRSGSDWGLSSCCGF